MKALLGTKIGMTQIINPDGVIVPVTLIKAGPCVVTQLKTTDQDGYQAVQIGFEVGKNLSRSVKGHVAKSKAVPRYIREVRVNELPEGMTVGAQLDVQQFSLGDLVDVSATSKGKGFAGNVKRNNFSESAHSHGAKAYARKPGSIGSMYPQKVFKGKRMAGQMGGDTVTVKNLVIALVDLERGVLAVKGAVPGPRKGLVMVGGKE